MKLQDLLFIILFIILVIKANPKLLVISGIICLILAIPLFSFWIFFTAERLTWYAGGFFTLSIALSMFEQKFNPPAGKN